MLVRDAILLPLLLAVGCSENGSEPRGESIAIAKSALGNSSFVPPGYACVWHDEFGGDQGLGQPRANLDESSWSFQEINANGEAQVYTTKQCLAYTGNWNYCVEDGRLRLQGRSETVNCVNNPVCAPHYGDSFHQTANLTSGRLLTKQKVHFSDGYIEFRVKLPQADRPGPPESGIWPAVWMLGENINQGPPPGSVNWPGCGEVDIMEWSSSGAKSQQGWNAIWLGPGGTNACSAWPQGGNAACGPCDPASGECIGQVRNGARYEMTGWPNFDHHVWHTYGLKWENTGNSTSDQMTYFIDGVKMGVLKLGAEQSAFKADMFLTMNMALGGTLGGPIQITDWTDTYMDVDYVRWYRNGQTDVCGLGGPDGGTDAGVDAGTDVGLDASADVGVDVDAGTGLGSGVCKGLPDGTSCSDGNLCKGQETCQGGVCLAAGAVVTCAALDGCHVAGTCNPSTGICSNPAASDGTPCGVNACNGQETCQGGSCTAGPPCPSVQAPSGLTASAASSSVINLSWVASSTSGVTYDVFRSTSATFTPGPGSTVAIGQTIPSYSDTGLSASTTYYYFVEAVARSGTSSPSSEANATTGGILLTCGMPDIEACSAKSNNAACAFDGGVGTCGPGPFCIDDGGVPRNALICYPSLPLVEAGAIDANGDENANANVDTGMSSDAGPDANTDATAYMYTASDGSNGDGIYDFEAAPGVALDGAAFGADSSTTIADASPAVSGSDAGTNAVSPSAGCGCGAAGGSPGTALGSAAPVLFTVGSLFGVRRRARRRPNA